MEEMESLDMAVEAGIGTFSVGRKKIGDSTVPESEWRRDAMIRIPRVTRDALKLMAAIQRKTMNVLLVEIVDSYVIRHRNNKGFGDVFEAFVVEEDFNIKSGD